MCKIAKFYVKTGQFSGQITGFDFSANLCITKTNRIKKTIKNKDSFYLDILIN